MDDADKRDVRADHLDSTIGSSPGWGPGTSTTYPPIDLCDAVTLVANRLDGHRTSFSLTGGAGC